MGNKSRFKYTPEEKKVLQKEYIANINSEAIKASQRIIKKSSGLKGNKDNIISC